MVITLASVQQVSADAAVMLDGMLDGFIPYRLGSSRLTKTIKQNGHEQAQTLSHVTTSIVAVLQSTKEVHLPIDCSLQDGQRVSTHHDRMTALRLDYFALAVLVLCTYL